MRVQKVYLPQQFQSLREYHSVPAQPLPAIEMYMHHNFFTYIFDMGSTDKATVAQVYLDVMWGSYEKVGWDLVVDVSWEVWVWAWWVWQEGTPTLAAVPSQELAYELLHPHILGDININVHMCMQYLIIS